MYHSSCFWFHDLIFKHFIHWNCPQYCLLLQQFVWDKWNFKNYQFFITTYKNLERQVNINQESKLIHIYFESINSIHSPQILVRLFSFVLYLSIQNLHKAMFNDEKKSHKWQCSNKSCRKKYINHSK
jgi:hypothetical protein